jgi:hypothetical protein
MHCERVVDLLQTGKQRINSAETTNQLHGNNELSARKQRINCDLKKLSRQVKLYIPADCCVISASYRANLPG